MNKVRILAWVMIGAFAVTLGGCANTPPTHFYLLRAQPLSVDSSEIKRMGYITSLGIGPISLPKYLDRPQIVTQASRHELHLSEYHQWAEPLKDRILHVLSETLSTSLTIDEVMEFPWKPSKAPKYQLVLQVGQFDGTKNKDVTLKARWALYKIGAPHPFIQRSAYLTEPWTNSDYEDLVEAMSRILKTLGQEIAGYLRSSSE